MRDGLEARLDGLEERLGAMERWQRGQVLAEEERADNTDPLARQESAAVEEQHERGSDSEELGITNFGLQTPAFINTRRRDRAPLPHELRTPRSQEHHNERNRDSHTTYDIDSAGRPSFFPRRALACGLQLRLPIISPQATISNISACKAVQNVRYSAAGATAPVFGSG
ncbi:hypothetical protein A4X06_0g3740 [Tilletia controversa]|uniref:Uncharacterized protein n=1 Tax=Tilletia controversa TaxID=13291 RepID=A0A8X7MV44_9BASI|nr:hypothetical protein A4X06_0g3740 [Tilletia controversa]